MGTSSVDYAQVSLYAAACIVTFTAPSDDSVLLSRFRRTAQAPRRRVMMARFIVVLWVALAVATSFSTGSALAQSNVVILSTTTSTQDSGLLDVLVPLFERKTGLTVKTISVGTGQALVLAARGEADVTLAHAASLEKKYVAEGKMTNRRLVMYNDFVIIGPPDDPAKIKGSAKALDAFERIAESQSRFVSRGDKSGTHVLELALWKQAGIEPKGAWYIES